jgi:hypothetical protein
MIKTTIQSDWKNLLISRKSNGIFQFKVLRKNYLIWLLAWNISVSKRIRHITLIIWFNPWNKDTGIYLDSLKWIIVWICLIARMHINIIYKENLSIKNRNLSINSRRRRRFLTFIIDLHSSISISMLCKGFKI